MLSNLFYCVGDVMDMYNIWKNIKSICEYTNNGENCVGEMIF